MTTKIQGSGQYETEKKKNQGTSEYLEQVQLVTDEKSE